MDIFTANCRIVILCAILMLSALKSEAQLQLNDNFERATTNTVRPTWNAWSEFEDASSQARIDGNASNFFFSDIGDYPVLDLNNFNLMETIHP